MRKFVLFIIVFLSFILGSAASHGEPTDSEMTVHVDEIKSFSVEGIRHNLTLEYIDNGAALNLDGIRTQETDLLIQGDIFEAKGVDIEVNKVVPSSQTSGEGYMNFNAESSLPRVCKEVSLSFNCEGEPKDPDGDGLYEDVNGDGELGKKDIEVLGYAFPLNSYSGKDVFDFGSDGIVNYRDVHVLHGEIDLSEPLGFWKEEDWRDEEGHYDAYRLDVNNNSYIGTTDVFRHSQGDFFGKYNPNDHPEELKYDYNCDESVNLTDSNILFRYMVNNGDYRIGDLDPGCDYDEDGTPFHKENEGEKSLPRDPKDPDGDGLYEDVDGDGDKTVADAQRLKVYIEEKTISIQDERFNFDKNGNVTNRDVYRLYNELTGSKFDPKDIDGDGLYEDTNADSSADVADVVELERALKDEIVGSNDLRFDFNNDEVFNMEDIKSLFQDVDHELKFERGWNLVSLPAKSLNKLKSCDLKNSRNGKFWTLKGSDWSLDSRMDISAKGYFVYAESACEADTLLNITVSSESINLKPGWNTISVPFERSFSSFNTDCDLESPLWGFNSKNQGWNSYSKNDTLDPIRGYSVKANSSCSINY